MPPLCLGGRPRTQEIESLGGGGPRSGGVDGERESRVGDHVDTLVRQIQISDDAVMEQLAAGAVQPDVVAAPAAAEVSAPGRQLADEVVQRLVVRVATGLGAIFAALWAGADLLGRKIERERAAAWDAWRAEQG